MNCCHCRRWSPWMAGGARRGACGDPVDLVDCCCTASSCSTRVMIRSICTGPGCTSISWRKKSWVQIKLLAVELRHARYQHTVNGLLHRPVRKCAVYIWSCTSAYGLVLQNQTVTVRSSGRQTDGYWTYLDWRQLQVDTVDHQCTLEAL